MRDDKLLFSLIAKKFKRSFPKKSFISSTSSVPVSGKVFDEKEMINGVEAVLDGCGPRDDLLKVLKENFATT